MKKQFVLMLFLLIVGFVFATPSLPHTFIGEVEYGNIDLEGYDISARVGNWDLGVLEQVQSGNAFEVFIDPQGHSGEILFYVGGAETEPTFEYEWGGHTEDIVLNLLDAPINALCGNGDQEPGEQCDDLDLGTGTCENVLGIPEATGTLSCTDICTFDYSNCTTPFCGDDSCNNDETCSNCPIDCGSCSYDDDDSSTDNSGGSSGGGPSGGGPSGGSPTTTTTSATSADGQISITAIDETSDEESETIGIENQETTGPGITGGVIGFVKSKIGIGLIIASFLLIVGIGIVNSKKKLSVKEKVEEEKE